MTPVINWSQSGALLLDFTTLSDQALMPFPSLKLGPGDSARSHSADEEIVKDLIARLMDERGLTMQQAFDAVYTSHLFEKLSNPKTGLYFQSSGYVYSFLESELRQS